MTQIDVLHPETFAFTEEALAFADQLLGEFAGKLHEPLVQTSMSATDVSAQYMRDLDLAAEAQLDGTDFLYIGHTNSIEEFLYRALLTGYAPSEEQVQERDKEEGDFLWNEVQELFQEHGDVDEFLSRHGYDSTEELPLQPGWVGSFVVPKQGLKEVFATLYLRGQDYKEWGWEFPWIDEDFTPTVNGESEA